MLSYPALQNLRNKLISAAETVLRSNDKKVIDLIDKIESQMTPLREQQYKHYREIEVEFIDKYAELKDRYNYEYADKFSMMGDNDLNECDKAYKACEKFRNLFGDLCIEAGRCDIVDSDNKGLTNDIDAHKKYAEWYEEIEKFQKEVYDEIQDQVNEQLDSFYKTIELVESKLKSIEAEENKE